MKFRIKDIPSWQTSSKRHLKGITLLKNKYLLIISL